MERIVRRGGDILGSLEKKLASWPTVTAEQRACTEAAFARSEAFVAAARKAGYNSVWKSNPACCAACRELNGQTLRGNFRPPLHAGCSCAVALGERFRMEDLTDSGADARLQDEKWLQADFHTAKKRERHVGLHAGDYGEISAEQYVEGARELLAAPISEDVFGYVDASGFLYKYRKSENDFAVGHPGGSISTRFKPEFGEVYWIHDREANKA